MKTTNVNNRDSDLYAKRDRIIARFYIFLDICLTVVAFGGAFLIKKYLLPEPYRGLSISPNYYIVLLIIIITWFIHFEFFHIYATFAEKKFSKIILDSIKAVSIGMIFLIATLFVFKIKDISRILLGLFYFIDLFILIISKRLLFVIWLKYGQRKHNVYNIILVGSKERAQIVIDLIKSSNMSYNIIGCLEIDAAEIGKQVRADVKIIGVMEDLKDIIVTQVIDEVIFAMSLKEIESVDIYMLLIEMVGIKVRILPDWHIHTLLYKPKIASIFFENFHGIPTMILSTTSSKHNELLIKTVLDYITTGFIFLFIMPFMLIIAGLIKFFSWGPVFFKQERVGLNGRKFILYKYRTMVPDAEARLEELKSLNEADGPVFKIKDDPRIIPFIGTILRKSSLDELPQLINVLKGEMSLVGPRPPIQSEVNEYDVWQRRRLSMKPGLTCLWQIEPRRNDLSFNQWMALDLKYIDEWSLSLDFEILLRTVKTVIVGSGR